MKRLAGAPAVVLGMFVLLVAAFFSSEQAGASGVEQASWFGGGEFSPVVVRTGVAPQDEQRDALPCQFMDIERARYSVIRGNFKIIAPDPLPNDCWIKTSYGFFSDKGNLRLGDSGGAVRVDAFGGSIYPLPESSKVVYYSGGHSFGNFRILDNIYDNFQLLKSSYPTYQRKYSSPIVNAWLFKFPGTDENVRVAKVGVSDNGKWLAVEASDGFWRVNIDTYEAIKFANQIYAYGLGLNPSYKLTVSNDGRYVVIGGGDSSLTGGLMRLYDVDSCPESNITKSKIPTGSCSMINLKEEIFGADHTKKPQHIRFSSSGEYIFYGLSEGGLMTRYMITMPGVEHRIDYVALGDSYTSGEGDNDGGRFYVTGTDGDGERIFGTGIGGYPYWKEKCHISMRSYPYLLASDAGLGAEGFRSVACSGSNINDMRNTDSDNIDSNGLRYNGRFEQLKDYSDVVAIKQNAVNKFIPGREAQIKFLEKHKPKVATIGIGGNDIDFAGKLKACVMPAGDTCEFASTNRKVTGQDIYNLYDKLTELYDRLHHASPGTKLYAVGYPQIITSGGSCGANVHLDDLEQAYAVHTVNYLNTVIRSAARDSGVHYLDIDAALAGTSLCSSSERMSINGLTAGSDVSLLGDDTRWFGPIGNESYHPNEYGHQLIYAAIKADLVNSAIDDAPHCARDEGGCEPSGRPPIPPYFDTSDPSLPGLFTQAKIIVSEAGEAVIKAGETVVLNGLNSVVFSVDSTVRATLHSTPQDLGTLTVSADGRLADANVVIPKGTPPGYHTLYISGLTPLGEPVNYYQTVFVYATADDVDGDGIPDTEDACLFVEPLGADVDKDGVDDGCDGNIGDPPVESEQKQQVGAVESSSGGNRSIEPENRRRLAVVEYDDGVWQIVGWNAEAERTSAGALPLSPESVAATMPATDGVGELPMDARQGGWGAVLAAIAVTGAVILVALSVFAISHRKTGAN